MAVGLCTVRLYLTSHLSTRFGIVVEVFEFTPSSTTVFNLVDGSLAPHVFSSIALSLNEYERAAQLYIYNVKTNCFLLLILSIDFVRTSTHLRCYKLLHLIIVNEDEWGGLKWLLYFFSKLAYNGLV